MESDNFFGKSSSDLFGGLFEIIGGFLISIGILKIIELLNLDILDLPLIIGGVGYLFFCLGFFIKTRNKKEFFKTSIYLAFVLLLICLVWWLVQINSK